MIAPGILVPKRHVAPFWVAGSEVAADRRHRDSDLPVDYPSRRCPANVAPAWPGSSGHPDEHAV